VRTDDRYSLSVLRLVLVGIGLFLSGIGIEYSASASSFMSVMCRPKVSFYVPITRYLACLNKFTEWLLISSGGWLVVLDRPKRTPCSFSRVNFLRAGGGTSQTPGEVDGVAVWQLVSGFRRR